MAFPKAPAGARTKVSPQALALLKGGGKVARVNQPAVAVSAPKATPKKSFMGSERMC